jgi:RHS repeat-associated protein
MTYDHNGNIKTLKRKQREYAWGTTAPAYTAHTIDSLSYTYASTDKNKLAKVDDPTSDQTGFKNGANTSTEYRYDVNGNLTSDKNKGIDSVYYNFLGKPVRMDFSDGKKIEYTYDAAGMKLAQKLYHGDTLKTTTHYVNGFVYEAVESGSPVLSFFGSPEGRVVNNGGALQYEYSIADHQGNTRIVFTSATPSANTTTVNFESATNSNVLNYTRTNFELFDHTDVSGSTYTYSQKLTGASGSQIGVAKTIKVYPGDKVKIEAYAKYYNPSGTASNITGFALALTGAFGVTSSSTGEALKAYNTLNNYGGIIAAGGSGGSSEHPKLFVNILLFDKDYNFLDAAWEQIDGGEQVGATPKAAHDLMSKEVTVKEAGYAYVFISNENPTLVEFYVDDVVITHTPTNVIQYNEYYPFGLQTSTSWTREETKDNNYLYNAANELNKTSGWYEMYYRGYDPAIGRMLQVDPYATMYASSTTYNYALNNPVMMNDPSGGQGQASQHNYERNVDGISDIGLDRMNKINFMDNPGNYYANWDEHFRGTGGEGAGRWGLFEYQVYAGGVAVLGWRKTQWEWVPETTTETGWAFDFDWIDGPIYLASDKKNKNRVASKVTPIEPLVNNKGDVRFKFRLTLDKILLTKEFKDKNRYEDGSDYLEHVMGHETGHVLLFMDIVNDPNFTIRGYKGTANQILINSGLTGAELQDLAVEIVNKAAKIWSMGSFMSREIAANVRAEQAGLKTQTKNPIF